MLVPPGGERVVDVDQLLGELVEVEPLLGVAINLEPGAGDRLRRTIAKVESGALQRRQRSFAQARLFERRRESRAVRAALIILVEEIRLLEAEPEFDLAKLLRLEPRRSA